MASGDKSFVCKVLPSLVLLVFAGAAAPATPAASPTSQSLDERAAIGEASDCTETTLNSGALSLFCLPANWNGDLVVYAHGYVSPFEPLALPADSIDGIPLPSLVNQMGYAYATTSYRRNGLVIPEAVEDLVQLVAGFRESNSSFNGRVFLVGVSEGGLITTLAVEKHPDVFSGGLALCGPVGDFRKQINYFGDFLVIFNYFFPDVLDGANPEGIPGRVIDYWPRFENRVRNAISSNPHATEQLLKVTRAPVDPADPASVEETVLGILWYNVFATNNAIRVLQGQPFDNTRKFYFGSDNDWRLNFRVQRVRADATALEKIERGYQTSGDLAQPLVTMHTTGDEIVPYWHEPLYSLKALLRGSGLLHTNIPIVRYGHCNFKVGEVVFGFAALVLKVTGRELLFGLNQAPSSWLEEARPALGFGTLLQAALVRQEGPARIRNF